MECLEPREEPGLGDIANMLQKMMLKQDEDSKTLFRMDTNIDLQEMALKQLSKYIERRKKQEADKSRKDAEQEVARAEK